MGKKRKNESLPKVHGWIPYKKQKIDSSLPPIASSGDLEVPKDWKEKSFELEDNPHGRLFASSTFSVLFPKYREEYLRSAWPLVKKELQNIELRGVLDVIEGTMTVSTTFRTFDPMAIIKGRDMLRLLARSVPIDHARKVLTDAAFGEVIRIHHPKQSIFVKRRFRLIGPEGQTLKAIELLTDTYMMVQGKTVAVVGSYRGINEVRKIVQDCMNNVHPIYNIKILMIKQKLMENENLRHKSWDRYLPKIKKQTLSKRWKPHKISKKAAYTPFPPPQKERDVDKALQSGTFFKKKK